MAPVLQLAMQSWALILAVLASPATTLSHSAARQAPVKASLISVLSHTAMQPVLHSVLSAASMAPVLQVPPPVLL